MVRELNTELRAELLEEIVIPLLDDFNRGSLENSDISAEDLLMKSLDTQGK